MERIQEEIPSFQGVKFSDKDLLDFGQCVDQNCTQQLAFLFGVDEVGYGLGNPPQQLPGTAPSGPCFLWLCSFHMNLLYVSPQQLLSALVMGATGAVGR